MCIGEKCLAERELNLSFGEKKKERKDASVIPEATKGRKERKKENLECLKKKGDDDVRGGGKTLLRRSAESDQGKGKRRKEGRRNDTFPVNNTLSQRAGRQA